MAGANEGKLVYGLRRLEGLGLEQLQASGRIERSAGVLLWNRFSPFEPFQ